MGVSAGAHSSSAVHRSPRRRSSEQLLVRALFQLGEFQAAVQASKDRLLPAQVESALTAVEVLWKESETVVPKVEFHMHALQWVRTVCGTLKLTMETVAHFATQARADAGNAAYRSKHSAALDSSDPKAPLQVDT